VAADLILDDDGSTLAGRQIGPYRIVEEIGRGGMGIVYAAEDARLGRTVALKALPPDYTRDPARRERLTREARAAAALSHAAIATIFALEELDGELYLVSELVRGRTLRDEIRGGALPPARLLETLIAVADGLAAAHRAGIVHRDLKPENIVRRDDGQVKILDFGLALMESGEAPTALRLTQSGMALGTPGYMAPEQFSGAEVDARADVFAFGVLAWELATGQHPFGADGAEQVARMADLMQGRGSAILTRPLPIDGLSHVLRRCIRTSPAERYASAEPLLDDLRVLSLIGAPVEPSASAAAPGALWWWKFHQATVALVNGLTPVAAWFVRTYWRPFGAVVFFVVLALATLSVTLRLNQLFMARVDPAALPAHRARIYSWMAGLEALLAIALLIAGALVAGANDGLAAILVTLAIVTIASLGIIEPATTTAAGIEERADSGKR
jgi:predicted Ser/Thr protein kinase